jgi:predicted nucleic acid-binding protein
MIFVDTGAWYAASVPDDPDHAAAAAFMSNNRERLGTSDYVLDEVLTLLKARGEYERALDLGQELLNGNTCKLIWVQATDVERAWNVFAEFGDKEWSFTDCVSLAVMERLRIRKAFAFDHHFRQFGTVEVVPQ